MQNQEKFINEGSAIVKLIIQEKNNNNSGKYHSPKDFGLERETFIDRETNCETIVIE